MLVCNFRATLTFWTFTHSSTSNIKISRKFPNCILVWIMFFRTEDERIFSQVSLESSTKWKSFFAEGDEWANNSMIYSTYILPWIWIECHHLQNLIVHCHPPEKLMQNEIPFPIGIHSEWLSCLFRYCCCWWLSGRGEWLLMHSYSSWNVLLRSG